MRRPRLAPDGAAAGASGAPSRATIHDIAREAGVSTATVSRVFNQPEKVSARTRDRVEAVIARHHYVSDALARGLASRRSRTLGLVIPTIMNSIYASSTQAIQQAAQEVGYTVLIGISEFSADEEALLIHRLLERRVQGLILTGRERRPDLYEKIRHNRTPFVITWRQSREAALPSISFDNYRAAQAAVAHLIALGHRRIGLICGRSDVNDRALDRRRAFEDSLQAAGLTPDPSLIFERSFEFVDGRAAMHTMLARPERPTAVFCANDIQAIGAMYECQEAGVAVPRDMSIVGFDDLPMAAQAEPALTTMRQDIRGAGARLADMVCARLGGAAIADLQELLEAPLIERESSGPAP